MYYCTKYIYYVTEKPKNRTKQNANDVHELQRLELTWLKTFYCFLQPPSSMAAPVPFQKYSFKKSQFQPL